MIRRILLAFVIVLSAVTFLSASCISTVDQMIRRDDDDVKKEEIRLAVKRVIDPFAACRCCLAFDVFGQKMCVRHVEGFLKGVGEHTTAVRRAARYLLVSCAVESLPVDLDSLAKKLGLVVLESSDIADEALPECFWGLLHHGPDYETIVINSNMNEQRKRFTIAHEIAEWALGMEPRPLRHSTLYHQIANEYVKGEITGQLDDEVRCDVYAMEILAPTPIFLQEAILLKRDGAPAREMIKGLAETFDITEQAVVIKFWILGVDPETTTAKDLKQAMTDIGPWSTLLHKRFYTNLPLEATSNIERFLPLPVRSLLRLPLN